MQSLFAVKNETSFPTISIEADGEYIFKDILKGETSRHIFLPVGSIALSVFSNSGKPVLNRWISIPPKKRLLLLVHDRFLKFV